MGSLVFKIRAQWAVRIVVLVNRCTYVTSVFGPGLSFGINSDSRSVVLYFRAKMPLQP